MSISVTTHGYTLHARNGATLAYREHVEQALLLQRETPLSVVVRRVSDGAVIAIKRGRRWAGIAQEVEALAS